MSDTMELLAPGWADYAVIDSGDGMRLERLGKVVIARQCATASWPRTLPPDEWQRLCHATHFRPDQGGGHWTQHRKVPEHWTIGLDEMCFEMRLTQFGHVGIFAEQQVQWPWITGQLSARKSPSAINLFAYTGGSTLAAALGGAQVTHVDAVKGITGWARQNAGHSGLGDAPIRWIVDDAPKFCRREVRRQRRYDAVILDPPTFGRGPQGSVWKIEQDLVPLLETCEALLSDDPAFLLLSAHTPGMSAGVLRNLLQPLLRKRGGRLVSGDMAQQAERSPCIVPAGVYCRWLPQ